MLMTKVCSCGQKLEFEAEHLAQLKCPVCGRAVVDLFGDAAEPAVMHETVLTGREKERREWEKKNKEMSGTTAILLVLLVVVGALVAFQTVETRGPGSEAWKQKGMYKIVTNAVTEQLKAPRSAVFDGPEAFQYDGYDQRYTVRGYVDSQNGFGALVRNRFVVELKDTQVVSVTFPQNEPERSEVAPVRYESRSQFE